MAPTLNGANINANPQPFAEVGHSKHTIFEFGDPVFTELRAAGPESRTSTRSVMVDGCIVSRMQPPVRFRATAFGMESAMNHGNDPYDRYGGDWFSGDRPMIVTASVLFMFLIIAISVIAGCFH